MNAHLLSMNGCNFGHLSFVVDPVIDIKLRLMGMDDRSLCCKFDVEMDMIVGYEDLGVAGTPYKFGFICNFSRWPIDILCDMILFNSKT